MKNTLRRFISVLLSFLLLALALSFGCAPAVQPSDNMTPDPEPTDVPVELMTIEPTALPEETPAPETSTQPEASAQPEPTVVPVVDYVIAKG